MSPDDEARFWPKVRKCPITGCWDWAAARNSGGYGHFRHDGRVRSAYKVAFEHFVGPVPEGLELDHLCRNRACVNPAHLEPVPHRVNVLRGVGPCGAEAAAERRNKPHCPAGHPYDGGNLYVDTRGSRSCLACALERKRAKYASDSEYRAKDNARSRGYTAMRRLDPEYRAKNAAQAKVWRDERRGAPPLPLPAERTHCPAGHEYAGENLYVTAGGGRQCRTCNRERERARSRVRRQDPEYRAKKAADARARMATPEGRAKQQAHERAYRERKKLDPEYRAKRAARQAERRARRRAAQTAVSTNTVAQAA